jgi:hypothetical protein
MRGPAAHGARLLMHPPRHHDAGVPPCAHRHLGLGMLMRMGGAATGSQMKKTKQGRKSQAEQAAGLEDEGDTSSSPVYGITHIY